MDHDVESQWFGILEHSHDIIMVVNEGGKTTYVNPAIERILGYTPDEMLGENAFDYMHPDERDDIYEQFTELIEDPGETTDRVEHRLRHSDGDWVWVESIGSNRTDTAIDGYVINSRDISEIKERRQALQEYKAYAEAIFDSFEDGFFVMDTEANIRRWNHVVTAETGYSDEEVASMAATDFVPDDHQDKIAANLREVLDTGTARFEADLVANDGSRTPYEFIISRLENPAGETVVAGIGRDISERRARERRLRRFQRAIEAAGNAIYIADRDGVIEYVNPAFENITGYSSSEAIGQFPRILKSGEMADGYYEDPWETIINDEVWEEHVINRRKSGELYHANQTIAAISDDGEIDSFVAIQTDITERMQLETSLQESIKQLKVIDRVLRHNLHNDMTLVQGYAETIQTETEGTTAEQAEMIVKAGQKLLDTVDKEREITELLSEPPSLQPIDLGHQTDVTVEEVQAEHPKAEIDIERPDEVSVQATEQIARALHELLTNAIVHCDQSVPSVRVTVERQHGTVELSVADNGPGIPEMERRILIENVDIEPLYHGSGLGLWLVHLIVERSDGELQFDENEPRGSIVTIQLHEIIPETNHSVKRISGT